MQCNSNEDQSIEQLIHCNDTPVFSNGMLPGVRDTVANPNKYTLTVGPFLRNLHSRVNDKTEMLGK